MMTGPDDIPNRVILEKLDLLTEVTQGIMMHIDRTQAANDARIDRLGREMNHRFDLVDDRFKEVNVRFGEVNVRLDRLEAKRRRPKNRD